MTRPELERFAAARLREHVGSGWTFRWTRAKTRLGECRGADRRIGVSVHIVTLPQSEQIDTVLHEVAHAIDHERRGFSRHDAVWREICREIGARPERLARSPMRVSYRWHIECLGCGAVWFRHRLRRDLAKRRHAGCGGRLRSEPARAQPERG